MKCHNCSKNAMYQVGPPEQEVPLCLECSVVWQAAMLKEREVMEREYNQIVARVEAITGMHGITPKYPEIPIKPVPLQKSGGVTLNNFNFNNSQIGVLNTGTIGRVDATITILKKEGHEELASAVTSLSEALIKSNELSNEQKDEAMELLSAISEQGVVPKEKQKNSVVKALMTQLGTILSNAANLVQIWEPVKGVIDKFFSM